MIAAPHHDHVLHQGIFNILQSTSTGCQAHITIIIIIKKKTLLSRIKNCNCFPPPPTDIPRCYCAPFSGTGAVTSVRSLRPAACLGASSPVQSCSQLLGSPGQTNHISATTSPQSPTIREHRLVTWGFFALGNLL